MNFAHSGILTVWCLTSKFGSNISYSTWDRRPVVPDVRLMTSRKLISGFDFWLLYPSYYRVTSSHQMWFRYLHPRRDISILRSSRWPPSCILDCFGAIRLPVKAHSCWVPPKNFVMFGLVFSSYMDLNVFVVEAWKSYLRPQKVSFWVYNPQNLGKHHSIPKRQSLRRVLSFHWSRSDSRCV